MLLLLMPGIVMLFVAVCGVYILVMRRLAALLLLPFPVDASIKSWHSARARMFLARARSSHALQHAVARHAPQRNEKSQRRRYEENDHGKLRSEVKPCGHQHKVVVAEGVTPIVAARVNNSAILNFHIIQHDAVQPVALLNKR